jgi:DNA-nicking Smr family endonuclease
MNQDPEDEAALFRAAMRGVQPLKRRAGTHLQRPAPSPHPRQREADERAVLKEMMEAPLGDAGEALEYRTPGLQDTAFRRLRRGQYHSGAELDLHGLRSAEAATAVSRFLAQARDRGERCVRIVHGKGLRSKGDGPVLKQRLDGWLRRRDDVLAFCSALPAHGGTGAVYVLLRAPRPGEP